MFQPTFVIETDIFFSGNNKNVGLETELIQNYLKPKKELRGLCRRHWQVVFLVYERKN
jgi:hypothetical protein